MIHSKFFTVVLIRSLFVISMLFLSSVSQVKAQKELSIDSIVISRRQGIFTFDGKVDDEDLLIFTTDFGKINCK